MNYCGIVPGACRHCIPNLTDKGLVLIQITFVVSQSQYALDTGTDHGCFSLLLAYETLYCFDLGTATALLLCEILVFLLYSAILEAVTQSPLKNLPFQGFADLFYCLDRLELRKKSFHRSQSDHTKRWAKQVSLPLQSIPYMLFSLPFVTQNA